MADGGDRRTRLVRNLVEPVAGVAFFAAEVHERYEKLGFPDPGGRHDGVRQFDWSAYFAGRAACMGRVSGERAAAAFGVFPVSRVAQAVDEALGRTTPGSLLTARLDGTVAALERLLEGDERFQEDEVAWAADVLDRGLAVAPIVTAADRRPLSAGLRSLPIPDTLLGRWWRLCDTYREHRMDVHVEVLSEAGIGGCEACILNDARQGLALGSYVVTRGWSEEQIMGAIASLRDGGLIDDVGLTAAGRGRREELEEATDIGQRPIVEAMADDLDTFEARIGWHRLRIIDGYGYPGRRFVENAADRAERRSS